MFAIESVKRTFSKSIQSVWSPEFRIQTENVGRLLQKQGEGIVSHLATSIWPWNGTVVVVVSVSFVNLAAGAWTHWIAPPQYNLPSVASDCRTIAKSGRSAYIRGQYPHCAPTINYVMPTDFSIGNKWANWWPPTWMEHLAVLVHPSLIHN